MLSRRSAAPSAAAICLRLHASEGNKMQEGPSLLSFCD